MIATIEERVAAGAAWLDANRPGWVDRIDLDTLNLGDPCRCVLGQEYGRYGIGLTAFGANLDEALPVSTGYGFDSLGQVAGEYGELTAAWRRLILARRAGGRR